MLYNVCFFSQVLGILLLLALLVYIINQKSSRMSTLFLILVVATLVNTIGYTMEMQCARKESAIACVRFAYFGKAYISFLMFCFISGYCKIRIPRIALIFLGFFHSLIALMVFTSDYQKFYYTRIDYTQKGMFPHLILGHGFFYWAFFIVATSYLIFMPVFCIIHYRRVDDKNERMQLVIMTVVCMIPMIGFILFLSGVTGGYDTTCHAYLIGTFAMFLSFFRNKYFDTVDLVKDDILNNLEDGILVMDNSFSPLYYNTMATKVFPELTEQGHVKPIIRYMLELAEAKEQFMKNKSIYTVKTSPIYFKKMQRGFMVHIEDVTSQYKYTRNLESAVNEKTEELKHIQTSIITTLAGMIEARDGVTGQHVKRTSAYVEILVRAMMREGCYGDQLTDEMASNIIQAAPLHDIGKIAIPDNILTKPAKLTDEEFAKIKEHPVVGAKMIDEIMDQLDHSSYLMVAREVALYHHEKWNGMGYPERLAGEHIPLPARIMAITDVYEALISERPYKKSFSHEKALGIIQEESGQHFDPAIVEVFVRIIDQIKAV